MEKEKSIEMLANILHENWRQERLDAKTGVYEPRIKTTVDANWMQAHGGKTEVDIANTPYAELPVDWQQENRVAAKQSLELIENALIIIHDRWLERNENEAIEEQKLRYSKLS